MCNELDRSVKLEKKAFKAIECSSIGENVCHRQFSFRNKRSFKAHLLKLKKLCNDAEIFEYGSLPTEGCHIGRYLSLRCKCYICVQNSE